MPQADLRLCRSLLFLPASNPRAIEKARELDADMVILDLEDSVRDEDKASAREAAIAATGAGFGDRPVAIRVNPTESPILWRGRGRRPQDGRRLCRARQGRDGQAGGRRLLADGQAGAGDDRDAARGDRRRDDRRADPRPDRRHQRSRRHPRPAAGIGPIRPRLCAAADRAGGARGRRRGLRRRPQQPGGRPGPDRRMRGGPAVRFRRQVGDPSQPDRGGQPRLHADPDPSSIPRTG